MSFLKILPFLCLIFASNFDIQFDHSKHQQYLVPPKGLERFAFGYSEASADLMWIRSIQDFDFCDKPISKKVCQNQSWLYHMVDRVTDFSPDFRIAYSYGAVALTVIITDIDGATKIFDKGIERFPNDWILLYRAAYHAIYETQDKEKAARYLIRAGQNGAPAWVFALAGRIYTDEGQIELAERLLADLTAAGQDEAVLQRLRDKIASKKAQK